MKKQNLNYLPMLVMLPAITVGTLAMYLNHVPAAIYLQNIACFAILSVSAYFLLENKSLCRQFQPKMVIMFCILALLLTFLLPSIEGVHRWIALGPIQLYVSAIVMPIVLIALWSLIQKAQIGQAILSVSCIVVLLTLQPDASMVTAFSVTSIIMLWHKLANLPRLCLLLFLGGITTVTWIFLDGLAPVAYVEGIFTWVLELGSISTIIGIAALAILVFPFFFFPPKHKQILSVCFGLFYSLLLLANSYGNFPVPLMGYGISPIIGYFIAIMWFTKAKMQTFIN